MSYFYGMDDTDRVDMVKLEIEIQEDILKALDDLEDVIKKFDGKVCNKKFYDAVWDACKFSVSLGTQWLEITYRPEKYIKREYNSYSPREHTRYIVNTSYDTVLDINEKGTKRINAEKLLKHVNEQRDRSKARIAADISGLEHIDEWKEMINKLSRMAEILNSRIPSDIKEYFDMDYCYRKR